MPPERVRLASAALTMRSPSGPSLAPSRAIHFFCSALASGFRRARSAATSRRYSASSAAVRSGTALRLSSGAVAADAMALRLDVSWTSGATTTGAPSNTRRSGEPTDTSTMLRSRSLARSADQHPAEPGRATRACAAPSATGARRADPRAGCSHAGRRSRGTARRSRRATGRSTCSRAPRGPSRHSRGSGGRSAPSGPPSSASLSATAAGMPLVSWSISAQPGPLEKAKLSSVRVMVGRSVVAVGEPLLGDDPALVTHDIGHAAQARAPSCCPCR